MKTYQSLCQFLGIKPHANDISLRHLSIDSRAINNGDVFCAYQGDQVDGHDFIQAAIDRGASLILCEKARGDFTAPTLVIPNLRQRLSSLAAWFYDYPSKKLKIIGVTGTNGKTSTSHYLAQYLHLLGYKAAIIGTVGNGIWGQLHESTFTTPEPVSLQRQLAQFALQGVDYVCMEVSSHALALNRVADLSFESAVFTNLTQDHLDFHGNMNTYAETKAKLFAWPYLKTAVLNKDDAYHQLMVAHTALTTKVYYYSCRENDEALISAQDIHLNAQGLHFSIHTPFGQAQINTALLGEFNVSNVLAAISCLLSLGFLLADLARLSVLLIPVKGRMEVFRYPGLPLVVIDYAHTPDALAKALSALKIYQKPLWVVFGCGGNRDPGKRPQMAKISEDYANHVIVTEDNSRFEAPEKIFEDIYTGFAHPQQVTLIPQRQKAIHYALQHAPKDAIILLAGKGHETYLDKQGQKIHFDERDVVKSFCNL